MSPAPPKVRTHARSLPLAIAVAYVVFGLAWLLGADPLIDALWHDASARSRARTAGMVLLVALGVLTLYLALRERSAAIPPAVAAESDERERPGLRVQLFLLAGAIALPLVALLAYNVQRDARRDQQMAERSVEDLARVVATDAARVVQDTRTTAESLALRPHTLASEPAQCDPQIAEIVKLLPYIANALSLRADGSVACTALPLPGPAVSFAGAATFQRVIRGGRSMVGQLARGPISGKWVIPIGAPIRDPGGAVVGALVLSIDVARLAPYRPPPDGDDSAIALIDSAGNVLMRVPEEGRVGANAGDSAVARIALRHGDGSGRARGRLDRDQIFGFARVEGTDWVAIAAMPALVALASSRETAARSSIVAALLLLFASFAAYLAGRGIERPMRAIASAVRRVSEGDLSARAPVIGSRETAEVATQLNHLLERLPRIEAELRDSRRRLELVLNAAQEGILVTDGQDRITFASEAAARLLGYAGSAQLVGRTSDEALPEALAADNARRLPERRAGRADHYELRVRAQDGVLRWLFISATPLRSDSGTFEGVLAMLYDVTERKDVEERLARVTRLYWALSKVNEAIVRTADRTALLEETCQIIVQEGNFVTAFATLLDRERRALIPAASAGATMGPIGVEPVSLEPGAQYAGWDPLESTCRHASLSIL